MSEQNKAVIRKIREEALSTNRLDLLDGLYAANYRYHGGAGHGELTGPEAFKGLLQEMAQVLADYEETVEDQVAEGQKVVSRLSGHGRVVGELFGVAGDGKEFTSTSIVITAFNPAGLIEEEWAEGDALGILRQLEATPGS